MTPPRDIYMLAESVDKESWEINHDIAQMTKQNSWIKAFLEFPKMKCSQERTEIFYFILHLSLLEKIVDTNSTKRILEMIRVRYFSDSDFWQPGIALTDIHNVVTHIFR